MPRELSGVPSGERAFGEIASCFRPQTRVWAPVPLGLEDHTSEQRDGDLPFRCVVWRWGCRPSELWGRREASGSGLHGAGGGPRAMDRNAAGSDRPGKPEVQRVTRAALLPRAPRRRVRTPVCPAVPQVFPLKASPPFLQCAIFLCAVLSAVIAFTSPSFFLMGFMLFSAFHSIVMGLALDVHVTTYHKVLRAGKRYVCLALLLHYLLQLRSVVTHPVVGYVTGNSEERPFLFYCLQALLVLFLMLLEVCVRVCSCFGGVGGAERL